ncbi:MAG: hypothetical protein ABEJ65_02670 [bacterium]
MNPGRKLGSALLVRVLFAGALSGFFAGYLIEEIFQRSGYELILSSSGPFLGVLTGLLTGVTIYLIVQRKLLEYVTGIRDELAQTGDLPMGFEDDLNLEDQSKAVFDLVQYEVSLVSEKREEFDQLFEEASPVLRSINQHEKPPMDEYVTLMENRKEELTRLVDQLESNVDTFQNAISPLFSNGEIDVSDVEELDPVKSVLDYQKKVAEDLRELRSDFHTLQQRVRAWEKGKDQLREAISDANELLLDTSELYERFPDTDLPDRAEQLRQQTQEWQELADQIENGVENLTNGITRATDHVEELEQQARESARGETVWNNIKATVENVDKQIDRFEQAFESGWANNCSEQLETLETHGEWLCRTVRELREDVESEQEYLDDMIDLVDRISRVIGQHKNNE